MIDFNFGSNRLEKSEIRKVIKTTFSRRLWITRVVRIWGLGDLGRAFMSRFDNWGGIGLARLILSGFSGSSRDEHEAVTLVAQMSPDVTCCCEQPVNKSSVVWNREDADPPVPVSCCV